MGMPSGDSPAKAHQYYEYLQAHQQTMQQADTWHVRWLDLAWMWGFRMLREFSSAAIMARMVQLGATASFLFMIAGASRLAQTSEAMSRRAA